MADNKVKFLRGTSDKYAAAEKDNDAIYFTTDDGKLYIGDKEISGGGNLTIDDKLSNTSENPVQNKAIKTELDKKADKTVATTSSNGLMSSTDKAKLNLTNIAYGTCSTSGSISAKVVTITGNSNWKLDVGSIIIVKFTNTNTANNPTLNVNGTGAKSIVRDDTKITTSYLDDAGAYGRYIKYIYDGTNYVWIGWSLDKDDTVTDIPFYVCSDTYNLSDTQTIPYVDTYIYSSPKLTLTVGALIAIRFDITCESSTSIRLGDTTINYIWNIDGTRITTDLFKKDDVALFMYTNQTTQKFIDSIPAGGSPIINYGLQLLTINNSVNKKGDTMVGSLIAASNLDLATPQMRNIYITNTDLTAGTSELPTGSICLVYE